MAYQQQPEPIRYLREVSLYDGGEIPPYGQEYTFWMKAYEMLEKQYGHLPQYRGISQKFQQKVRMSPNGRVTWTSFFQHGQECSYPDALSEVTQLLSTMMLNTQQDRDGMRGIVQFAHGVINHRRTYQPLDHNHRRTIGGWEHLRDALQRIC